MIVSLYKRRTRKSVSQDTQGLVFITPKDETDSIHQVGVIQWIDAQIIVNHLIVVRYIVGNFVRILAKACVSQGGHYASFSAYKRRGSGNVYSYTTSYNFKCLHEVIKGILYT